MVEGRNPELVLQDFELDVILFDKRRRFADTDMVRIAFSRDHANASTNIW